MRKRVWGKCIFFIGIFTLLLLVNLVSGEILVSEVGVEYDSSILEKFANNNSVHVHVTLKDNSGIVIQGTPEQKENLSIQRSEWFKQEKEKVLAGFSQGEFNLTLDSSRFFEGDISQEGFSKLLNDPRIEEIYDITNAPLAHIQDENNTKEENEIEGNTSFDQNSDVVSETNPLFWITGILILVIAFFILIKSKKKKK